MAEIGALGGATLDTGNLKRSASIAEGVFGVLYTLSKDKAGPTKAQTVLIIALDILQVRDVRWHHEELIRLFSLLVSVT